LKENYLIYGGLLLWLVLVAGIVGTLVGKRQKAKRNDYSSIWLLVVGGSFVALTGYFTRTAPDARFFLPGLPFLMLPMAERAMFLPKTKLLLAVAAILSLLQGGYVFQKTYLLRNVSPGILAGIEFLKKNPPKPATIFMYPEGNYRLFPVPHEWYLGYRLRDFWRGDNDKRLEMLRQYGIGVIVVKKHLIAQTDEQITNLGVYPDTFVTDLRVDGRFSKPFENNDLVIFQPPADTKAE